MRSIKASLIVGLLLGFGLLLGGGGFYLNKAVEEALITRFDAQLRSEAMTILSFTKQEDHGADVDVEFTDRYLREYDDEVGTRFFQMTGPNKKLVDKSESLGKARLEERFGNLEVPQFYDLTLPGGNSGRAMGIEFVPQSKGRERRKHDPNLLLGLVVAADRQELDATLGTIRSAIATVGFVSAFGALMIVGGIVGLSLRPVRRLAGEIETLDAQTLGKRVDQHSLPGELQPIAVGLNRLLHRLESSFRREKQFSSDVAHELRTPIAELRSLAEVALKWPDRPSGDAGETDPMKDALGIARQMDGIVSSLLAITRSEMGRQTLDPTTVLVSAVISETWRPLAEKAAFRNVTATFQITDDAHLVTDKYLFGLIWKNLLENAVTYTPRRGAIRVLWQDRGRNFNLLVANTTDDLTADDIPNLFERFWRKEAARSSADHSGLGLSLARAYARTLDLNLTAELVGKDIVFTLSGPKRIQPESSAAPVN